MSLATRKTHSKRGKRLIKTTKETRSELVQRAAYWTYDDGGGFAHCYYFAPRQRRAPPYHERRRVTAIIDIADDGTLAGVDLVLGDLPPPPKLARGKS